MDRELSDDYCHQQRMARLDQVQKELLVLQEKMRNTSTKCNILQVDLATQFNPHKVEALKKVTSSRESCKKKIQQLDEDVAEDQQETTGDNIENAATDV